LSVCDQALPLPRYLGSHYVTLIDNEVDREPPVPQSSSSDLDL